VGLTPGPFASALQAGQDAAYVLASERTHAIGACTEMARLIGRAPWLGSTADPAGGLPAIVPLLDTPSMLVLRRGIVGAAVDGSGLLHLERIRRVPPEALP
jgi:hypothetical protein